MLSVGRPMAPPACCRKVSVMRSLKQTGSYPGCQRSRRRYLRWRTLVLGGAQRFLDVFLDVVESDASLLGVLDIDVERRGRARPGVVDAPMRAERSLVAVWSLGKRRHSSSSEVGWLVEASKRREPASVGRRLIEAPRQVRTSERWVMDTSGREKGSLLVGRLVEASGLLKMASGVRLVEASRLLKMSSVVRAARLHLRRERSSQLNGWELLLLLLLKRGSWLDGWELLLLLLIVHDVVPAT